MKHLPIFLVLVLCMPFAVNAQKRKTAPKQKPQTESREVKRLRGEKTSVQKKMQDNEQKLKTTKQDAMAKQRQVAYIEQQLSERVDYIRTLERRIDSIDKATVKLEKDMEMSAGKLDAKKKRYAEGLRYARSQRLEGGNTGVLLFAMQADTWQQMYRRARYAREYAAHQETLGRQIMAQQENMRKKQHKLLGYKTEMNALLNEISVQRRHLMNEHRTQQQLLGGLRTQQDNLAREIEKQRRHLTELDNKIDEVIAREIEAARKRAEEAERRRLAEAKKKKAAASSAATSKSGNNTGSSKKREVAASASSNASKRAGGAFITTADRELSGSFERNKGRLPVPISGPYRIGTRMGTYQVDGMKGVKLENKGTHYIGKAGACARAIYDGEVTAVFSYDGMTNVLVRHGSYISVYCNLTSVRVRQGQKVKARDLIGSVGRDENGETALLFQLRKEKVRLNPESWIAR